ncbi:MAG: glutamate 5-kinase [Lachnospiraceae bacterium]|nr:glutamate 5-kinase [Lachnospiraceae bacterium]
MDHYRELIKNKKRIVVKVGSSSLRHKETGEFDYIKMETLVRELCDIRNKGKDVILVSSGAIAAGKKTVHIPAGEDTKLSVKQACAAIGQARLMMTYERLFSQYGQVAAQILMTKNTIVADLNRFNAHNTFSELLKLGVIPIVNENDTISTYEIEFGDNDTLSAIVAALVGADLLILLSDIDGLYTDDPRKSEGARFLPIVPELTEEILAMGKASTGSDVGTGGMNTKLHAAEIATRSGADMIIANSKDMRILHRIMDGRDVGTLFLANKDENFYLKDYVEDQE